MRVSSSTSIPSSSQASSSSGVGGLCDVRNALQPISCSFRTRYGCTASGRATPTPAWSWWLQVPFTFTGVAVQEEALVRIEPQVADAEPRLVAVRDRAAGLHLGDERVEVPLVRATTVPAACTVHLLLVGPLGQHWRWTAACSALPDLLAGGIESRSRSPDVRGALRLVLHLGPDGETVAGPGCTLARARTCPTASRAPARSSPARRGGRCPRPRRTSRRSAWHRTRTSSTLRRPGVREIRHVEAERVVAAEVPADVAAVEDDDACPGTAPSNSTEIRRPASDGGQVEDAPVPARRWSPGSRGRADRTLARQRPGRS